MVSFSLFKHTPRLTWPLDLQGHCMFQTLKSNISIHFLSSQFTTSTTITWFHPKWISPADLSVASKIMQPHKQWWLYLTDLWSRCELSWCWVRTFPICCVWRNHRKTPVFRLLLAGDLPSKPERERWQRLVRHTEDTCSPEWRRRLLLSQTASQCSPLKCSTKRSCNDLFA